MSGLKEKSLPPNSTKGSMVRRDCERLTVVIISIPKHIWPPGSFSVTFSFTLNFQFRKFPSLSFSLFSQLCYFSWALSFVFHFCPLSLSSFLAPHTIAKSSLSAMFSPLLPLSHLDSSRYL